MVNIMTFFERGEGSMWEKVWDFIKEKKMLQPGDRVMVAVSGGADSICLLKVLSENQMGLILRAMHVFSSSSSSK